mgnify:CR=1 FL=1
MTERHPEKKPDTPAPAPVPTVGALLRQRRQMRGQSIDAVHQATRIPRGLLQALEEDRHGEFAAPVYLHGFLKSYCDHLELEYLPLWQRVAPPENPVEEDGDDSGPDLSRLASPSVMPLFVLGGLLAVGVAAWAVSRLARTKPEAPAAVEPIAPPAAPAVEPAASTAAFTGPVLTPVTAPTTAPVPPPPAPLTYPTRLLITATSAGQVTLHRDGRLVFEGRLPPGKYLDWRGTTFILHASNPKGLRVELGGQAVDLAVLRSDSDGSYRLGKK